MSTKMPDKYDEERFVDVYDEVVKGISKDIKYLEAHIQLQMRERLKRAFPPPAEDARQAYSNIQKIEEANILPATGLMNPKVVEEAAAEISRFAESRVEPWREALRQAERLYTEYGLIANDAEAGSWINKTRALLSDSPAKEADK